MRSNALFHSRTPAITVGAILVRNVAVEPEDDRLLRFRQRRRGVLLLEAPAFDVIDARRQRVVAGVVEAPRSEIPDAVVGGPRGHRRFGQPGEVVIPADEQAADVGHRRWQPRKRRRSGRHRGLAHPRQRIVGVDVERGEVRRRPRVHDVRVAGIERIGLAVGPLELAVRARDVGEQQRRRLDQHRFALGMRLRDDRRAREQAVGECLAHGRGLRRLRLREVARVERDQLHLRADLAEGDEVAFVHHPAEEPVLADARAQVDGEEVGDVELLRRDLQPGFLVLLPDPEQAGHFLRVLDDVGERLRLALRDGGRRCGRRRCGRRCRCGSARFRRRRAARRLRRGDTDVGGIRGGDARSRRHGRGPGGARGEQESAGDEPAQAKGQRKMGGKAQ